MRLEILLTALFISVSYRYKKKKKKKKKKDYLSAFCDWVKRLQRCVSVKEATLKVCNKNMLGKTQH